MTSGRLQIGVEPDLCAVGPGAEGETSHHVLDHIEAVGRNEALWELRSSLHPVDAVRTDLTPQVVVPGQVPAATVHHQAVRVDLTGQARPRARRCSSSPAPRSKA
jgi:hypothetical protein